MNAANKLFDEILAGTKAVPLAKDQSSKGRELEHTILKTNGIPQHAQLGAKEPIELGRAFLQGVYG